MDEITSNDKLLAALSYPLGLVAIIILLVEDMKSRPFQKYHAVQALAVNVVLVVVSIILGIIPVVGCIVPLIWLVTFYWAYKAYQGEYFDIPVVTDFVKGQGWLS